MESNHAVFLIPTTRSRRLVEELNNAERAGNYQLADLRGQEIFNKSLEQVSPDESALLRDRLENPPGFLCRMAECYGNLPRGIASHLTESTIHNNFYEIRMGTADIPTVNRTVELAEKNLVRGAHSYIICAGSPDTSLSLGNALLDNEAILNYKGATESIRNNGLDRIQWPDNEI